MNAPCSTAPYTAPTQKPAPTSEVAMHSRPAPLLENLYAVVGDMPGEVPGSLAVRLERHAQGSLSCQSRLVSFPWIGSACCVRAWRMAFLWRKWRVGTVCNCEGFGAGCARIGDKVWRAWSGIPIRIVAIGTCRLTSSS
jgi:hypothetical protein